LLGDKGCAQSKKHRTSGRLYMLAKQWLCLPKKELRMTQGVIIIIEFVYLEWLHQTKTRTSLHTRPVHRKT